MASLVTLATLRQSAQQRADMENSTFLSTAEWNGLINASAKWLYDKLVAAYEDYFEKEYSFTTTSNQDTYALPSDFYKLLGTDQVLGNGQSITLEPYEALKRNSYQAYNQAGNVINLRYIPTFTNLSADGDTFDGVNGWEEFIIVDAARKAAMKEEAFDLANALQLEKNDISSRIDDLVVNRDGGFGDRVNDVTTIHSRFDQLAYPQITYRLVGQNIRLMTRLTYWGAVL